MPTEAQNRANRRNAPKSTAPRTNRLSSPACQPIMTSIMQNKPNLLNAQMNVNKVLTKDYENERLRRLGENKPNQTQFQSHRLYACFNFLLWDVVRRKLCSVTVYPIRGSLYLREPR